jgi:hypothetical protein
MDVVDYGWYRCLPRDKPVRLVYSGSTQQDRVRDEVVKFVYCIVNK